MVAGQYRVPCPHTMDFITSDIADVDRSGAIRLGAHTDRGAVEPDADRLVGLIDLPIVEVGKHDILHRRAGGDDWNQAADEQSGYRSVRNRHRRCP